MRIGELLLLKEKIDPWLLSHTLKEQATTQQRLISLLVGRAQLDPDDGALVLSEQLGYPAALQRHLERRDPAVLDLLPRELGSRWVVLPLGRARTGAIVVVTRDPSPILSAALEHAMRTPIMLAVTPSVQLERLVRAAYGLSGAPDDPMPVAPPTMSDVGDVRLEDETPLPIRRARTVSYMFKNPHEIPMRVPPPQAPIEATLSEVDRAITAVAVERLVMAYVAKRWTSSLLARIDGDRAVGLRGHGIGAGPPNEVSIPLGEPSIVSMARDRRQVISGEPPVSKSQERVQEALGGPTAAAPVIASGEVVAVLVVGSPTENDPGRSLEALAELDRLVDALGAAYDRFSR
jgi:hypothetical protein